MGQTVEQGKVTPLECGDKVYIVRGGKQRGNLRQVKGVFVGPCPLEVEPRKVYVMLAEDDPQSDIEEWSKVGDVGHWAASQVAIRM